MLSNNYNLSYSKHSPGKLEPTKKKGAMDLAPESALIEKENQDSSATTITLFLTTFVAVAGSFVFGSAVSL